ECAAHILALIFAQASSSAGSVKTSASSTVKELGRHEPQRTESRKSNPEARTSIPPLRILTQATASDSLPRPLPNAGWRGSKISRSTTQYRPQETNMPRQATASQGLHHSLMPTISRFNKVVTPLGVNFSRLIKEMQVY